MEDLSKRSAQEVLDDHLNVYAEESWERLVEEEIRRNVSEDMIILINRGAGVFCGHEGVRQLARILGE